MLFTSEPPSFSEELHIPTLHSCLQYCSNGTFVLWDVRINENKIYNLKRRPIFFFNQGLYAHHVRMCIYGDIDTYISGGHILWIYICILKLCKNSHACPSHTLRLSMQVFAKANKNDTSF